MTITIKRAEPIHASGIANVFRKAFNEEITVADVGRGLQIPHYSLVALEGERVVGLTGGFITTAHDGQKRLELDLQAVHPDYQGQGIGTRLIQQFCNTDTEFNLIRALVAVDRHHMHYLMTKLGFISDRQSQSLYIATQSADTAPVPEDAHVIPVTTLSYLGIWLEGNITQQAIHSALSQRPHDGIVGAVVPANDAPVTQLLMREGFSYIKDFHWWIKSR
ncbi:MAG: GNAT family N-acetyltransferase [Chloroflexota bacterium]